MRTTDNDNQKQRTNRNKPALVTLTADWLKPHCRTTTANENEIAVSTMHGWRGVWQRLCSYYQSPEGTVFQAGIPAKHEHVHETQDQNDNISTTYYSACLPVNPAFTNTHSLCQTNITNRMTIYFKKAYCLWCSFSHLSLCSGFSSCRS